MNVLEETYDVAVVGAGHAGCEAALACARLGLETIMFTVSVDSIALMPCNPNIGGTSKGHLVREIDALGGEMGKNIDKTFIQSKMLNVSKGPAVHSLRAQADKQAYTREMRRTLENTEHLTIRQAEVTERLAEEGSVTGVQSFSGAIYHATGPRYCPSIEDKVVKFADKNRHQVFIEPEGLDANEMYVGGMSSSLPEDVQYEMYRSVKGLEHVKIVRNAYAIEYDCINARQLYPTLEFKNIKGLFSGGQFNGSSGYEEAAAQGLVAGINAAMKILGKEQLILDRSESYIGVLIDDLVTKENHEPYRMMTSRAEYRLLLRQDNADLRLRKKGYEVGLITQEQYDYIQWKEEKIKEEVERMEHVHVGAVPEVQQLLERYGSTLLKNGISLADLIRRPELSYDLVASLDKKRPELPDDVREQVNINIKYDGYIKRQLKQVEGFKKLETKRLPETLDYDEISGLRIEAKQKLKAYRPVSVGQASRIAGVSPADISVLLVYMESYRRR